MFKRLAIWSVVVLASVELLLQLGALVVALTVASRAGTSGAAEARILCVGDSFTYGVGASGPEGSYPGQLERLLRQSGRSVEVANAGWPGQDSRDVLRKLESQLDARTTTVCLLIGTNDSWRHPELLDEGAEVDAGAAAEPGFEFRWRTGRLLALLLDFETGAWQRTGAEAAPADGEQAPSPEAVVGAVDSEGIERVQALAFDLLRVDGLLPDRERRPVPMPRAPEGTDEVLRRIRTLRSGSTPERALALCEPLLIEHPESGVLWMNAAMAATRAGDGGAAERALARLRELVDAGGAEASPDQLLSALWSSGHQDDAVDRARIRVEEEPDSLSAWDVLARAAYVAGDPVAFERAAREALALRGARQPGHSGFLLRRFARSLAESDPARASRLLVAATVLDQRVDRTRLALRVERRLLAPGDALFAAIDAYGEADAPVLRELRAVGAQELGGAGSEEWLQVLSQHVRRVRALTERRGIELILACYPFRTRALEDTQRELAAELGIPFVPVRERFDRELVQRSREQLFVADGHCNDAGYALMAEEVFRALDAAGAAPSARND